jgi:hypothetical protein
LSATDIGARLLIRSPSCPPHVLDDDERRVVELAVVVDLDDVRMAQEASERAFALEAFAKIGRLKGGAQEFDDDERRFVLGLRAR